MNLSEIKLQPIFVQELFAFEDQLSIPEHYNDEPLLPNFFGQWALFTYFCNNRLTNLALDVLSEEQAELLGEAKANYFEQSIKLFRHTPTIYLLTPAGDQISYYKGRSLD